MSSNYLRSCVTLESEDVKGWYEEAKYLIEHFEEQRISEKHMQDGGAL